MRVKSEPVVPSSSPAGERQAAKARQDKWMLEIEKAMLVAKPPQTTVAIVDAALPTPAALGSSSMAGVTDGTSSFAREERIRQVSIARSGVVPETHEPGDVVTKSGDEHASDSDPAPPVSFFQSALRTASAKAEQVGTADTMLSTPVRTGGTVPEQPHGLPPSLSMSAASTVQLDQDVGPAPQAAVNEAATAAPAEASPAQAATQSSVALNGLSASSTAPMPFSSSAITQPSGEDASTMSATLLKPEARQPNQLQALVSAAQKTTSMSAIVEPASVMQAEQEPIAQAVAQASFVSIPQVTSAYLAPEPASALAKALMAPPFAVQTAARDEAAHEESAQARSNTSKSFVADAEPYGTRNLHVVETDEGIHAWVRDAGLASKDADGVAQALAAEFVQHGTVLESVTVNGRVYPLGASPETDIQDGDDFVGDSGQERTAPSEKTYIKGAV